MEIFPYVNCLLVGQGGDWGHIEALRLTITGDFPELHGQFKSLYKVPGSELGYVVMTF